MTIVAGGRRLRASTTSTADGRGARDGRGPGKREGPGIALGRRDCLPEGAGWGIVDLEGPGTGMVAC